MTIIRGLSLGLLTLALGACGTLSGNLWPTVPKGLDAVRQTSGNAEACDRFELRYGGDEGALKRFISTLVRNKWQPPEPSTVSKRLHIGFDGVGEEPGYLRHERKRDHFNSFLDCYFIDLSRFEKDGSQEYTPEEAKNLKELYALRGHAIVTVLARYAAYNLTGRIGGGLHTTAFPPYEDVAGDASSVLARIEHTQRLIRRYAPANLRFADKDKSQVQQTDESLYGFESVRRINRINSVIQLAFEAERPTLRRAQGFLTGIAGLVTRQSVTDFKNVLKHAVAGLEKAALLGVFNGAYRSDINAIFDTIDEAPSEEHWMKIDKALEDACVHLATIADGTVPHCLPSTETAAGTPDTSAS